MEYTSCWFYLLLFFFSNFHLCSFYFTVIILQFIERNETSASMGILCESPSFFFRHILCGNNIHANMFHGWVEYFQRWLYSSIFWLWSRRFLYLWFYVVTGLSAPCSTSKYNTIIDSREKWSFERTAIEISKNNTIISDNQSFCSKWRQIIQVWPHHLYRWFPIGNFLPCTIWITSICIWGQKLSNVQTV